MGQNALDAVHDIEGGRLAALQNRQQGGALAVLVDDIGLHGIAVVDMRHIPDINRSAIGHANGNVVQVVNDARLAVEVDVDLFVADLGGSRRAE